MFLGQGRSELPGCGMPMRWQRAASCVATILKTSGTRSNPLITVPNRNLTRPFRPNDTCLPKPFRSSLRFLS